MGRTTKVWPNYTAVGSILGPKKKIKFLRSKIIPLSQWYNQVESWRLKFGNPNIHLRSRIVRSSQDQHNMGIHLFLYHKCFDLMKSRIFPSKNGKHGLTQTPNHPCREKEKKKGKDGFVLYLQIISWWKCNWTTAT